ncbi:MAG: hypothetical protein NC177_06585 [Ruminococcus flavefaciens]|nr:hypothetical protein [Ruminococcus flavefaciens]
MELVELYNKAVSLVEKVKSFSSQTAEENDVSLCVIVSDSNEIYAGITGIRIKGENVTRACSEYNALMSMIADGHVSAKQMMTVSFADGSICLPCSECIDMLYKADENNTQCEIALSVEKSVKACEIGKEEPAEPETVHPPIEEAPVFSDEPVSDSFSFEEKFGFDFDDTPAEPVPTLADQNTEPQTVPEQPVNPAPYPEQYQNIPQQPSGMNPQFIQPDNMQGYSQSQGYPYPQQTTYPQGYPYPQQAYQQGYPYPQQAYPQQPNGMNPQFVQPDNMSAYSQQYGQPVNQPANQGSFPYNAQPYPQNPVQSQPIQSVSPHQPAPYTSSHYINSGMGSGSVPTGSVPLSGEGKSKFRQRLNKFMGEDSPVAPVAPVSKPTEESLSKDELKRMARDKKKMAKVNADFKKRMKDLGY